MQNQEIAAIKALKAALRSKKKTPTLDHEQHQLLTSILDQHLERRTRQIRTEELLQAQMQALMQADRELKHWLNRFN